METEKQQIVEVVKLDENIGEDESKRDIQIIDDTLIIDDTDDSPIEHEKIYGFECHCNCLKEEEEEGKKGSNVLGKITYAILLIVLIECFLKLSNVTYRPTYFIHQFALFLEQEFYKFGTGMAKLSTIILYGYPGKFIEAATSLAWSSIVLFSTPLAFFMGYTDATTPYSKAGLGTTFKSSGLFKDIYTSISNTLLDIWPIHYFIWSIIITLGVWYRYNPIDTSEEHQPIN
jgi:hypothetical protein